MNSIFSSRIKQILKYSKDEAIRLHNPIITPEHLMLGLLRNGEGVAYDAMHEAGVDFNSLQHNIETHLQDDANQMNVPTLVAPIKTEDSDGVLELAINKESDRTLKISQLEARMLKSPEIDSEHLLLALLKDAGSTVSKLLEEYGFNYSYFYHHITETERVTPANNKQSFPASTDYNEDDDDDEFTARPEAEKKVTTAPAAPANENHSSSTPVLDSFGFDLTQAAEEGKLDPVVGREFEIERVAQILSRRKKNNPILIGEPGVGKSAIVEGLALRIVQKKVSWLLYDKRVVSLDMASLVAGTKYRGQFEERIKAIMNELRNNKDVILFIDEIHTIIGAGSSQGSMDAANILKPALSRGEIQCIGATTLDEFRKSIEKDGALDRRFQKVLVEPTSPADTLLILHNIKSRYEEHHNVIFTDDALEACVTYTDRYITDRNFPDKAIDALDEAGSRMHLLNMHIPEEFETLEAEILDVKAKKEKAIKDQNFEEAAAQRDQQRQLELKLNEVKKQWSQKQKDERVTIDKDKIAEVVSQMSNIPIQKVASSEGEKLLGLKQLLQNTIIGQDDAVEKVVRAIQRNRVGLKDPNKPIGTFLFLGPTGVGKTYLAKTIAKELFAGKDNLIRVDMSEYMEKYSVSRLIGAPPGYVGHEEGGQLTERVRRHPYSVILFDEIEKAHPDVFNLLLQVFDEGHLTDSLDRKVDFKNTIIIMTSNVGSRQLNDFGTGIGFSTGSAMHDREMADGVIRKALNKTFSPEFLNRIDDIIMFHSLDKDAIHKIIRLEVKGFLDRIKALGYEISITDNVCEFLANVGYDKQMGARPLKRAIQNYLENEICETLLMHQDKPFNRIVVDMPADQAGETPSNQTKSISGADKGNKVKLVITVE